MSNSNLAARRRSDMSPEALQLVAAAIGNKMGVKVEFGRSPQTDGKIIYLPVPQAHQDPKKARESACLMWGFLDHEAAHVRFTEFGVTYHDADSVKKMTNIIEDIRIEQRMGETFPGAALNLGEMIPLLIEKGWFRAAPKGAPLRARVEGYILQHLRAKVLGQKSLANFAAADRATLPAALLAKLDPLLAWTAPPKDTRAARALAIEILALIKDAEDQEASTEQEADGEAGDEVGDEVGDEAGDEANGEAGNEAGDEANGEAGNEAGDEANGEAGNEAGDEANGEAGNEAGDEANGEAGNEADDATWQHPIIGAGGDIAQAMAESMPNQHQLSNLSPDDSGTPWRDTDQADTARANRLARQLTHAISEPLQTATMARTRLGFRGPIMEQGALHRVGLGDGRLFRAKREARRPDTAVAVLLDVSGSMMNKWHDAALATLVAMGSMRPIKGIALGLLAFPAIGWLTPIGAPITPAIRAGILPTANGDNTPTGAALLQAGKALMCRPESRRVVICVTDGCPNHPIYAECQALAEFGIETIGIGIGSGVTTQPMDRWIPIDDAAQLRLVLGRALREVALR